MKTKINAMCIWAIVFVAVIITVFCINRIWIEWEKQELTETIAQEYTKKVEIHPTDVRGIVDHLSKGNPISLVRKEAGEVYRVTPQEKLTEKEKQLVRSYHELKANNFRKKLKIHQEAPIDHSDPKKAFDYLVREAELLYKIEFEIAKQKAVDNGQYVVHDGNRLIGTYK
jgi:hypothetical protein